MFIIHHPFILRSSPNGPLDQQPQQIHTSNQSSRLGPKALEDPLIHQPSRSSPDGPLKKSIHPVFKIKLKSPRRSVHQLFIPRSSPDGPLDQQLIHKPTPYEDRIRGSNYKEIVTPKSIQTKNIFCTRILVSCFRNFPCLQIWHAQWDYLYLSSLSPLKIFKHSPWLQTKNKS